MTVDYSSSTDYNFSEEFCEHSLLVKLLSKYKIILQKQNSSLLIKRKYQARVALTKEFNDLCQTNLTVSDIERKIYNIKSRLTRKNSKDLSRSKRLPFLEWEKKFLSMWAGNEITDAMDKSSHIDDESKDTRLDEILPATTEIKSEPDDDDSLCHENVCSPEAILSDSIKNESEPTDGDRLYYTHNLETPAPISELGTETQFDESNYANLSLDELKRTVLLAQLKKLKAEKAAAIAKEKVQLYKLSILQKQIK